MKGRDEKNRKMKKGKLTREGALETLKPTEERRGRNGERILILNEPQGTEEDNWPVVFWRNTQLSKADNLSAAQDSALWPPPAPPPSFCSLEVSTIPLRVLEEVGRTLRSEENFAFHTNFRAPLSDCALANKLYFFFYFFNQSVWWLDT